MSGKAPEETRAADVLAYNERHEAEMRRRSLERTADFARHDEHRMTLAREAAAQIGLRFDCYQADDGAAVVHIETDEDLLPCNERGPRPLRVYLNDDTDAPLWANPPAPGGADDSCHDVHPAANHAVYCCTYHYLGGGSALSCGEDTPNERTAAFDQPQGGANP